MRIIGCTILLFFSMLPLSVNADKGSTVFTPEFPPKYQPDLSTDEGGLWASLEKMEEKIKTSPKRINDEVLTNYLKELSCKLAKDYCSDIRIYIIENPNFNAFMTPNGMMVIWTGVFLRTANEAELASIVAHEIAHFLRAHSVKQFRSAKKKLTAAMLFDLMGGLGVGMLMASSSHLSHSRFHETEADEYGLHLLHQHAFPVGHAASLWGFLEKEQSADKSKSSRIGFLSTHPTSKERMDNLNEKAMNYEKRDLSANEDKLVEMITPFYFQFMNTQMALKEFGRSKVLLDLHEQISYPLGEILYFQGKIAMEDQAEDSSLEKAVALFQEGLKKPSTPAVIYREIAYAKMKLGMSGYQDDFRSYLAKVPDAPDAEMIDFYISTSE